ncbi:MAG: DUF5518 domain-containing protein [Candidatus Aenigmatarchaeota archaeon]
MNFKKIVLAALIFTVWSLLIGYFVPMLEGWATIMAALTAGIYAGYKTKGGEGFDNGLMAGFVGGVACGIIINTVSSFAGIPMKVATSEFLSPTIELVEGSFPWASTLALIIIGIIFAGMGGIIGSKQKLGKVFLFFVLFLLFIFYGAIDNVAWNWGREDWTWNMSVSHVLMNQIDIFVAVVFAAFTTLLAVILFH